MNTEGFYKIIDNNIVYGPTVETPSYILLIEEKDNYNYPYDGWVYANSLDEAIVIFANIAENEVIQNYAVPGENYSLATSRADETEFNKLITLLQLGISRGDITDDYIITIVDSDNNKHQMTVDRFFEIMVGYGMFCYQLRNL